MSSKEFLYIKRMSQHTYAFDKKTHKSASKWKTKIIETKLAINYLQHYTSFHS